MAAAMVPGDNGDGEACAMLTIELCGRVTHVQGERVVGETHEAERRLACAKWHCREEQWCRPVLRERRGGQQTVVDEDAPVEAAVVARVAVGEAHVRDELVLLAVLGHIEVVSGVERRGGRGAVLVQAAQEADCDVGRVVVDVDELMNAKREKLFSIKSHYTN